MDCCFSNNLGAAIGFLQMPAQVPKGRGDDIPHLLWTHAAMALFASALTLAYFPASPPTPPSHAAELMMRPIPVASASDEAIIISHRAGSTSVTVVRPSSSALTRAVTGVMREFWACCRNPSFMLLAVAGGGVLGVFNGWSALYTHRHTNSTTRHNLYANIRRARRDAVTL